MKYLISLCLVIGFTLCYTLLCLLGYLFNTLPLLSPLNAITGLSVVVAACVFIVILTSILQVRNETNTKRNNE